MNTAPSQPLSTPPAHTHNHRCVCHFRVACHGAGFRYTAQNLALQYNVDGYVRNLPDGRVELVVEGPDCETEELIQNLQRKMAGFIRDVSIQVDPATGEFQTFSIRH